MHAGGERRERDHERNGVKRRQRKRGERERGGRKEGRRKEGVGSEERKTPKKELS